MNTTLLARTMTQDCVICDPTSELVLAGNSYFTCKACIAATAPNAAASKKPSAKQTTLNEHVRRNVSGGHRVAGDDPRR